MERKQMIYYTLGEKKLTYKLNNCMELTFETTDIISQFLTFIKYSVLMLSKESLMYSR